MDYKDFRKDMFSKCNEAFDKATLVDLEARIEFLTEELNRLNAELREKYNLNTPPITNFDPENVYRGSYNISFISEVDFEQWKKPNL